MSAVYKTLQHVPPANDVGTGNIAADTADTHAQPAVPRLRFNLKETLAAVMRILIPPLLGIAAFIGIWALVAQETSNLPGP
jgi:nitrate/nitrite transport system permease protein